MTLGPGQTFYESPDDIHTGLQERQHYEAREIPGVLRQAEGRAAHRAREVSRLKPR